MNQQVFIEFWSSLILEDILPLIFCYLPNHLYLRSVCRTWDHSIQFLHSSQRCRNLCSCLCQSVHHLLHRYQHIPWIMYWALTIDLTAVERELRQHFLEELRFHQEHSIRRLDVVAVAEDLETHFFSLASTAFPIVLRIEIVEADAPIPLRDLLSFICRCLSQSKAGVVDVSFTNIGRIEFESETEFISFVKSPALHGLQKIKFNGHPNTVEAYEALSSSPQMSSLKSIEFQEANLSVGMAKVLSKSPYISGIQDLMLNSMDCFPGDDADGFDALISSSFVQNVTNLSVKDSQIPYDPFTSIAASPYLTNLQHLTMSNIFCFHERMEVDGLINCADKMSKLTALSLNLVPDFRFSAMNSLVSSPFTSALKKLSLRSCNFGHKMLSLLCASTNLTGLHTLDLRNNNFVDDSAILLSQCPNFPCLTALDFAHNYTSDVGAAALFSSSSELKELEILDIRPHMQTAKNDAILQSIPGTKLRQVITSSMLRNALQVRFPSIKFF